MAPDRKRAVLINMNAETDFVAKGDDFKNFLGSTLKLLLEKQVDIDLNKGDNQIDAFMRDIKFDASNTLEESTKLLTAKTKEKIDFSRIQAFKGSMV